MSGDSTQHVLDAIDGALLDYTVSGDAMRWTPEPPQSAPTGLRPVITHPYVRPDPEQVAEFLRRMGEALQPFIDGMRQMAQRMAEGAPKLHELLVESGLHPEQPPTDARARALWLVQHRNAGPGRTPAGHQKRPRKLT